MCGIKTIKDKYLTQDINHLYSHFFSVDRSEFILFSFKFSIFKEI